MEQHVRPIVESQWEFHCPECGLGHYELGRLAKDQELICEVCEHEAGRTVQLHRWPADGPLLVQARLRVGLVA
jgi:hypothetical protein